MKTILVARRRALLACLLALALACGLCPTPAFAADEAPATNAVAHETAANIAEGAADEAAGNVANFALYGPDGSAVDAWIPLSEWSFEEGATAADMTEALFASNGIVADIQDSEYGFYLSSITAADGTVYGFDAATGAYWGLYVNGVSSEVGADGVVLQPGDTVVWYYGAWSTELPNLAPEGFAPDAPLSASDNVAWGSYGGNAAGFAEGSLPLMEASADLSWTQSLLRTESAYANVSNLLVVDGLVYVAESDSIWNPDTYASEPTNAVLRAYNAQTGKLEKSMELPAAIDATCRMAYDDGVIAVPVTGGDLVGVAADTLASRWFVESGLEDTAQSLNSVTAEDGYFVHASAELDGDWSAASSAMVCVNAQTGALRWKVDEEVGSYWGGAAVVNGVVAIGTDAGTLRTVDFETGARLSDTTVADGARIRSSIVPCGGNEVVFSTSEGELVKAAVEDDGFVSVVDRVSFAATSTGTPSVVNGTAVVGGAKGDYTGVLAEIDLKTMEVVASHAATADVKSAPVVAQGSDGAFYAYFTCNAMPGALFGVRLGSADAQPFVVCEPASADRNYCMASPAADGEGRLFYTNDSGILFAISHDATCGYRDVLPTDWIAQDGLLERAVAAGLIGRDAVDFRPWDALTRAEVVTVIYRAAGEPAYTEGAGYTDVAADAWYRDAVLWAQAAGVASGYGDGSGAFGPDDAVTREQLAKMLGDYARNVAHEDIEAADASLFESLQDSDLASDWARTGLVWCCANGIITGSARPDGTVLDPQGGANRAMMAKMILLTLEATA